MMLLMLPRAPQPSSSPAMVAETSPERDDELLRLAEILGCSSSTLFYGHSSSKCSLSTLRSGVEGGCFIHKIEVASEFHGLAADSEPCDEKPERHVDEKLCQSRQSVHAKSACRRRNANCVLLNADHDCVGPAPGPCFSASARLRRRHLERRSINHSLHSCTVHAIWAL